MLWGSSANDTVLSYMRSRLVCPSTLLPQIAGAGAGAASPPTLPPLPLSLQHLHNPFHPRSCLTVLTSPLTLSLPTSPFVFQHAPLPRVYSHRSFSTQSTYLRLDPMSGADGPLPDSPSLPSACPLRCPYDTPWLYPQDPKAVAAAAERTKHTGILSSGLPASTRLTPPSAESPHCPWP